MDERPVAMTTFERLCLAGTIVTIGFAAWFRFGVHHSPRPHMHGVVQIISMVEAIIADIALFMPYILALLVARLRFRPAAWLLYGWELLLLGGAVMEARYAGLASAKFAQPLLTALLIGLALIVLNSPDSRRWRANQPA